MFGGSFLETYKYDKDYVGYYYVMALNNEGKLFNESGKGFYKDIFAFKIVYKNGAWQALIAPLAEKTNYNPNSEYTIKQWDIDINQYKNKK
jgi:hypothetical protein